MSSATAPSQQILGIPVDLVGLEETVDSILDWTGGPTQVAVGVNAHVCNMAYEDDAFHRLVRRADLRYADGQSIVTAARLFGRQIPERVATTDLITPLAEGAEQQGKRIFFFGGAPGVAESAAERLRQEFPALAIAANHGFVGDSEMPTLLDRIAAHNTDILFVGLGDPLQQEWVDRYRGRLTAGAVLTCGGLFDWVSGRNRRAPDWMIRSGMEWLWRLIIEPRRLAVRYVRGNPLFLIRLARQRLRVSLRRRG